MPQYVYECLECGKKFSTVLTVADHKEWEAKCPKCDSAKVSDLWAAIQATMFKNKYRSVHYANRSRSNTSSHTEQAKRQS